MARIDVYGGDFPKGIGWFFPGSGFVLLTPAGSREAIGIEKIDAVDRASAASLQGLGQSNASLRDALAYAQSEMGDNVLFVVTLVDGRILLASADPEIFETIAASAKRGIAANR